MTPLADSLNPAEAEGLQTLGRSLAQAFLQSLRSLRTHGTHNQVSIAASRALTKIVNQLFLHHPGIGIRAVDEFIYLGETRVRAQGSETRLLSQFAEELGRRGIGTVSILHPVGEGETVAFLQALQKHPAGSADALDQLVLFLEEAASPFRLTAARATAKGTGAGAGISHGELLGPSPGSVNGSSEDGSPRRRDPAIQGIQGLQEDGGERASLPFARDDAKRRAFFNAVAVHHGYLRCVRHSTRPPLRHARRTLQGLADQIERDEAGLIGLTTLKNHENYTFFHAVNVAVLSMAIGRRLGLGPDQLVELGMAALFHDVGKARLPIEILRRPGSVSPEDRATILDHPIVGTRELIRLGGLSHRLLPAMIGSFEHHMAASGGAGHPAVEGAYSPHVHARIVSIADYFDTVTTRARSASRGHKRDQVLGFMLSQAGKRFDATLLQLFVQIVGVYPVGTAVRLASGRLGVVLRAHRDPLRCHRPIVALIDGETGTPLPEPLDLSERGADGAPVDAIAETLELEEAGVDPARVFL